MNMCNNLCCCTSKDKTSQNYDVYVVVWQDLFDYEVDSDDEWEEEEPGESLSASEVLCGYKQSDLTVFNVVFIIISLSNHLQKFKMMCTVLMLLNMQVSMK